MKKQLLILCAFLVIANTLNAMEKEKIFSYKTGFEAPQQDPAVIDKKIIADIQAIALNLENNDISAMVANFQKLQIGSNLGFDTIIKHYGMIEIINKAYGLAKPATQSSFDAIMKITRVKRAIKQRYPLASKK